MSLKILCVSAGAYGRAVSEFKHRRPGFIADNHRPGDADKQSVFDDTWHAGEARSQGFCIRNALAMAIQDVVSAIRHDQPAARLGP